MKNLKTKTVKAFTLVELIVVMVILAILIGLAVPNVAKYIDKAGKTATLSEARSCLTAIQAFAAEKYGADRTSGDKLYEAIIQDCTGQKSSSSKAKSASSTIYAMAGGVPGYINFSQAKNPGVVDTGKNADRMVVNGSKVEQFVYFAPDGTAKVVWIASSGFKYYTLNGNNWDEA